MKKLLFCFVFVFAALLVMRSVDLQAAQDNVPRMTKEDLNQLLGKADVMVIDVRAAGDWDRETLMIKGAVREDPMKVGSWMEKYPNTKTLVFYCS